MTDKSNIDIPELIEGVLSGAEHWLPGLVNSIMHNIEPDQPPSVSSPEQFVSVVRGLASSMFGNHLQKVDKKSKIIEVIKNEDSETFHEFSFDEFPNLDILSFLIVAAKYGCQFVFRRFQNQLENFNLDLVIKEAIKYDHITIVRFVYTKVGSDRLLEQIVKHGATMGKEEIVRISHDEWKGDPNTIMSYAAKGGHKNLVVLCHREWKAENVNKAFVKAAKYGRESIFIMLYTWGATDIKLSSWNAIRYYQIISLCLVWDPSILKAVVLTAARAGDHKLLQNIHRDHDIPIEILDQVLNIAVVNENLTIVNFCQKLGVTNMVEAMHLAASTGQETIVRSFKKYDIDKLEYKKASVKVREVIGPAQKISFVDQILPNLNWTTTEHFSPVVEQPD